MLILFQVIVLIFSAIIHEYMHGWVADRLGDNTARLSGRLTLNPFAHLEWFGSFLLPGLMLVANLPFIFGWAKPVPYNPYNLKDRRWGEAKVALAGPASNFIVALFFAMILRFLPFINLTFSGLIYIIIYINLILMIFNLLPIPPLDGSKILGSFLSPTNKLKYFSLESFSFIFIILFAWLGFPYLLPVINWLFRLLVGD